MKRRRTNRWTRAPGRELIADFQLPIVDLNSIGVYSELHHRFAAISIRRRNPQTSPNFAANFMRRDLLRAISELLFSG
jgi:hypothetical protein